MKVMPNDYRRVLKRRINERERRIAAEAQTQPAENQDAELAAGLVRHSAEKAAG